MSCTHVYAQHNPAKSKSSRSGELSSTVPPRSSSLFAAKKVHSSPIRAVGKSPREPQCDEYALAHEKNRGANVHSDDAGTSFFVYRPNTANSKVSSRPSSRAAAPATTPSGIERGPTPTLDSSVESTSEKEAPSVAIVVSSKPVDAPSTLSLSQSLLAASSSTAAARTGIAAAEFRSDIVSRQKNSAASTWFINRSLNAAASSGGNTTGKGRLPVSRFAVPASPRLGGGAGGSVAGSQIVKQCEYCKMLFTSFHQCTQQQK